MGPPGESSSQGWNTANIDTSMVARKTRTSQPASASGVCRRSSRQDRPTGSSRHTAPWRRTAARDATLYSPSLSTRDGPAFPELARKHRDSRSVSGGNNGNPKPFGLMSALAGDKLTTPHRAGPPVNRSARFCVTSSRVCSMPHLPLLTAERRPAVAESGPQIKGAAYVGISGYLLKILCIAV